jgi:beta-glucosidase
LRQIYLPPFKAGFDAGAASTMSAFQDLGGVPATCNRLLLRTVLREEWDWQGVVVTDYSAVSELIKHGVAKDLRDAARLAILAGVDIDMDSKAYLSHLQDLVEDGTVPLELVEQAVRRVLRLKMNLGLFENPYVDESLYEQNILLPESRLLALEAARQSMVLIKNEDGVLPIARGGKKVALIGPLADSRADMLGTWASAGQPMDAETVLEGFQTYLAEGELIHVKGCETNGIDGLDIPAAVQAAQAADFVVLAVGEGRDLSGEARSRVHIELPGRQQELVDAIKETGKPLVVVLMSGRPLVIPRLAGQADALLIAWHAGIRTGQAVADLIFGEANPSGKLTVSWPRAEGQIPVYYNHKSTGRPAQSEGTTQFKDPFRSIYLDEPNEPLFAFGQGMSYTIFEYSDLVLDTPAIAKDGILAVSALVRNTGQRPGVEIVQLYIRDLVASVSRPVKELKGFQRISLQPGEAVRARFELPASDLGYTGLDMKYVIEPGEFKVWIGPDSISGLESDFIVLP